MDEIILVDIFDNELGHTDKANAHKKGLLHRAFSVFVVHDGKMLLASGETMYSLTLPER